MGAAQGLQRNQNRDHPQPEPNRNPTGRAIRGGGNPAQPRNGNQFQGWRQGSPGRQGPDRNCSQGTHKRGGGGRKAMARRPRPAGLQLRIQSRLGLLGLPLDQQIIQTTGCFLRNHEED